MNCVHCGTENHDGRRYCKSCAREVLSPEDPGIDTTGWINLDDDTPPTSKLALASLALGLLGIFPPAGVGAVALGHASLLAIRHNEGRVRGVDVAKLGLICGYVGLALFSVVMFTATRYLNLPLRSLLIPARAEAASLPVMPATTTVSLPSNEPTPKEVEGMNALLQLSVAETIYYHTHPEQGYTCSMTSLRESGLSTDAVTEIAQLGFLLSLDSCTKSPAGKITNYLAIVTPRPGVKSRLFCTDNTGVMRTPSESTLSICAKTGTPSKEKSGAEAPPVTRLP